MIMKENIEKFASMPGSRSTFRYPFIESDTINLERFTANIAPFWLLNRTAINQDTDIFVNHLVKHLDANLVEGVSGEECFSWQLPFNWKVRRAQLTKKNGQVIADFDHNPLHLWTHSVSFKGTVSREELLEKHICTDPNRPDEIMYHYRNGYRYGTREWGFSLPYNIVKEMHDDVYNVEIDSDLDHNNTLKVVDAFLPGRNIETIFIMAHTCHPGLISDGIGCVAIAIELFHYLRSLSNRTYSYRFIFGPEYFGALTYLKNGEKENIENLHMGLYLDMLTNHEPLGFQYSMQGNSLMDKVLKNVLPNHCGTYLKKPYRGLWGNDETFYNGPGFEIPTAGLGRGMHREYHYNSDNFENMSIYHAKESYWILRRILDVFENDYIPVRKFKGPLYLSRLGLYIDPSVDLGGAMKLERMQVMMNGKNSCMDIADILDMDFYLLKEFCDKLYSHDLIDKKRKIPHKSDKGSLV